MRLYRLLLHLYPASFRAEYGEEMAAIFRHRMRDAGGPAARAAVWLSVVPETLMNALAVHWDILKQDLRYTARTLNRSRGFALTAIVIVALGIGANTAAFSVTDFVLFRPLPFADADRLVTIWQRSPGYSRMELSPANIRDWKQAATSFERVGIHRQYVVSLLGAGEPERVTGASVSADLFPTLGVHAALGRIFGEGEDTEKAAPTVILSDRLWRSAFGADPGILGRKLILDEQPHTVIGVMPPSFAFPRRETEVWVPLVLTADDYDDRNNNELYAVGRLKPGATLESARTEMDLVAAQSRRQYPKENENTGATVNDLRKELSQQSRVMVLALSGAALCVLLIVCANLANLLLARALGRRLELAVRTAMGAGRERLIRQLATESIVLATLGGTLGIALAAAIVPLLWRLVPAALPTDAAPGIDLRVLAFAALLTLVTSIAFGLAPMVNMSRTGGDADARGLREGARAIGGRKERLRGALVIAEVMASVVLLISTGLLVRALWTIQARDPGFRAEGVLTLQTDIPGKYAVTARRAEFYEQVISGIRALPGVTNAAYISGLPMVWGGGIWPVGINGVEIERRDNNTASMRFVTPGFFATMRVPLRTGRGVSDRDTMTSQFVAVVSESFVKRYWPDQDAIGRTFNFSGHDRTIVGVVKDIRVRGLERDSEPQVYLPHRQVKDGWLWYYTPKQLVISATTPLAQLVPAVRNILRTIEPELPITDVRPMTDIIDLQTASRSVQVRVLAGFALVAFLLAAIGIHGVLSFAVSQRTPEIGVRIALGAQRRDILGMVMKQGVMMVGAGLLPGLLLAYYAGRSLETLLMGVTPADVPTFAAVTGLTLLMAFAGTLLPTLRALRVDPIKAIRAE
jgi:putative ABC transport system permease protein